MSNWDTPQAYAEGVYTQLSPPGKGLIQLRPAVPLRGDSLRVQPSSLTSPPPLPPAHPHGHESVKHRCRTYPGPRAARECVGGELSSWRGSRINQIGQRRGFWGRLKKMLVNKGQER